MNAKFNYYLEIADNALILSHRLAENCSKGPFLEEDLAATNVALDLIGMAESVFNEAAKLQGSELTGDDVAYRRPEWEYRNVLLAEQPNEDFAHIMVRQFFMDTYNYYFLSELANSSDPFLADVAAKSLKEITYHLRRSSEWMIRLGNGTDVSHQKTQAAIDHLFRYTNELFTASDDDLSLREEKISVDLNTISESWHQKVKEVLYLSTLNIPKDVVHQYGGKEGRHTEYMGHLLCELQYLPNKYPDARW